jgi:phage gp46-like protein
MADGVVIRELEGCGGDPNLLWDSVWDATKGFADWALAGPDENENVGGLRAKAAIETAVMLCLFTDRRIDPEHPLWYLADGDRRGWWGDGVDVRTDLHEGPLGSLLWLLERAPMTVKGMPIETWAIQFANEALQTLLDQRVCARIDVSAAADRAGGRLLLTVQLFAADGSTVFDRNFDVLWNQLGA